MIIRYHCSVGLGLDSFFGDRPALMRFAAVVITTLAAANVSPALSHATNGPHAEGGAGRQRLQCRWQCHWQQCRRALAALAPVALAPVPLAEPRHRSGTTSSRCFRTISPGEKGDAEHEQVTNSSEGRVISNVTVPTLSIFLPPKSPDGRKAPVVLVIPDGGFEHIYIDKEGVDVVLWLTSLGFVVAVLKYRVAGAAEARASGNERARRRRC